MAAMRVVVVVVVVGRRDDRSGHGREHGLPGGDELRHSRSRDNPRDGGAVPTEQAGIGTAFPLHRELRGLLGVGHNAVREFDSVSLLLRFTTYEIRIPGVRSVCDIPVDRGELHPLPRDRVAPQAVPVGTAIAVYMGMRIIGNSGRGVLPYVGIQVQILIGDVFRNGMDMHILPSGSARGAPDERGGPARRGGGRVHRRRVSFRRARMHAPISSAPFPSFDRFSLSYVPGSRFFCFPRTPSFFSSVPRAVRSSSGTPTSIIRFGTCSYWQVSLLSEFDILTLTCEFSPGSQWFPPYVSSSCSLPFSAIH